MSLIDELRTASYKGIECFARSSTIRFGQKTVIHQFPNTDRTEVEFLGLAQDQFRLPLYIYGDNYINKRNALKNALSESGPGLLVHPYEGEIEASVVDFVELIESDSEFGLARFNVTFQKTNEKIYPVETSQNSLKIRSLSDDLLLQVQTNIAQNWNVTTFLPQNYLLAETKLIEVADIFDAAQKKVPQNSDAINILQSTIVNFQQDINSLIVNPTLLSTTIIDLFNSIDLAATNSFDQVEILNTFFEFGINDKILDETTFARIESNKNNSTINQAVRANALSLTYATLGITNFESTEQLDLYRNLVEEEYQNISELLDTDVSYSLQTVRNEARIYFDEQQLTLPKIVTIRTSAIPLEVLIYQYYGSLDKFETIKNLNNIRDTALVEGNIKIISSV